MLADCLKPDREPCKRQSPTAVLKVQAGAGIGGDENSEGGDAVNRKKQRLTAKLAGTKGGGTKKAAKAKAGTGPKTRCDFQLEAPDGTLTFVEVKSVTLSERREHHLLSLFS